MKGNCIKQKTESIAFRFLQVTQCAQGSAVCVGAINKRGRTALCIVKVLHFRQKSSMQSVFNCVNMIRRKSVYIYRRDYARYCI